MTAARSCWPGHSTRAERRAARENILLEDVGITPSTLKRYYFAVGRLAPVLQQVQSETGLDEDIAAWIQNEFEDGTPLYMIGDALSGLHHFEPATRKKLTKSWRLYAIWRKYEVPCRAPPLPQDILLAMAGLSLQRDELTMCALLLLGFHCLLRTGEILALRPCDILLGPTQGLVTLQSSKSGVRNNAKESVAILDPITLEATRAMVQLRNDQGFTNVPCWDQSGSLFRTRFRHLLDALQVAELGFKPYSLRRGGATLEMQSHGLMEKTLVRGRWKNSNIARIYVSDGLSRLPSLRMTLQAKVLVAKNSAVFTAEHHCFDDGSRGKPERKGQKRKVSRSFRK